MLVIYCIGLNVLCFMQGGFKAGGDIQKLAEELKDSYSLLQLFGRGPWLQLRNCPGSRSCPQGVVPFRY